jgi:hypothetical protein
MNTRDFIWRCEGKAYIPTLLFALMAAVIMFSGHLRYQNYGRNFPANISEAFENIFDFEA